MGYLTPRALRGLKQYKYKAGGYTWLDDVHQPFWNGEREVFFPFHSAAEFDVFFCSFFFLFVCPVLV